MRDQCISAFIASVLVVVGVPGVLHAPLAIASEDQHTVRVAVQPRFNARLPLAPEQVGPQKIVTVEGRESIGVKTTASKVLITDLESNAVLFAQNADEQNSIASITKLITALVLREHDLAWNTPVTMTRITDGGGVAYFAPGDVVTVRDLWHAMLIGSSNTAANTLASLTGLSNDEFVAKMNAKARALGMKSTHLVEPTGLEKDNVSTPRDLTLLIRAILTDDELSSTVILAEYRLEKIVGTPQRVVTTDKLMNTFINKKPYRILGGKTGYITESGYNVAFAVTSVTAAPIAVVVLGSATNEVRFQEAKSLAYWAFENYRWPEDALARR